MDNTDVFYGYRFDYEDFGDSKDMAGITIYKKSGRIPMPLVNYIQQKFFLNFGGFGSIDTKNAYLVFTA